MSLNEPVAASVATLLIHHDQLLLGKRIKNNRFESWQCPGGYLLPGEGPEQCAKRLCLQKAGVEISDITQGPYTNNLFSNTSPIKHTVTLYVIAQMHQVKSPGIFNDAELSWGWYEINHLPRALFMPLKNLTEQYDLAQLIRARSRYS